MAGLEFQVLFSADLAKDKSTLKLRSKFHTPKFISSQDSFEVVAFWKVTSYDILPQHLQLRETVKE
jgi:hypothetical protein